MITSTKISSVIEISTVQQPRMVKRVVIEIRMVHNRAEVEKKKV